MGTDASLTLKPRRVKIICRRFSRRNADLLQTLSAIIRVDRRLILTLFLFVFPFYTFAQSDLSDLRNKIAYGSAEEKRSALFEIRSLHTEQGSRIAIPALSDKADIVRATAVSSVIFLPPDEALKLLLPLLNDDSEFVRRETAYAVGELGNPAAVAALIGNLQKEDSVENRSAAAMALGRLGNADAIESLLAILKNKPTESQEFVRRSAARSIGEIAQAIRFGKHQTTTPRNFLPDKFKVPFAQNSSPAAMPHAFDSATPILSKVIENRRESDDVRREAAYALGAIASPGSVQLLRSYSESKDTYLAEICKEALLNFPSTK